MSTSPIALRRVTVVGAGVIGLTVAHELAETGLEVQVVADVDTPQTVSAVAAALWFPFHAATAPGTPDLLAPSLARFVALADDPATGVRMRDGVVLERSSDPDRAWARGLPGVREATADELRGGALSGVHARLPMIEMPRYLPWLRDRVAQLGVVTSLRRIESLSELPRDASSAVVVAGGLRGGALIGDDESVHPVRGQIALLDNPGLSTWVTDDDNPAGLAYVFPRTHDVVVGGVAEVGADAPDIDADTQRAILERVTALVPELAGQPVRGAAAGLRPARDTVRIEVVEREPGPLVAAYGHGGAGVTLSWGTAALVRDLLMPAG